MKAGSIGNTYAVRASAGFTTLELIIAMAILSIAFIGAVGASYAAQYWSITSQTSNEGLYKAKTALEETRALTKQDFYQATSSPLARSASAHDPIDAACLGGSLCYFTQTIVTDISSCSKYAEARVSWQVGGYPTTTTSLFTYLTNADEAVALGGDCVLAEPSGDWAAALRGVGAAALDPGQFFTAVDVLHTTVYATASSSPHFLVYSVPSGIGQAPVRIGSASGSHVRLNDVDAITDLATGRTYAYVAQHATTSQLGVFDVTEPSAPTLVTERRIRSIVSPGAFSEGWKVFAYGNRLYVITRETSGNEFHVFNINTPAQPAEIGSGFELDRTVNDLVVRNQRVGGGIRRFVFLATDADAKELSVLDVTGDVVSEIASIDLPGNQDAASLSLAGNTLYVGRQNGAGPELYAFDATDPSALALSSVLGRGEVGADVIALRVSGAYVFTGTGEIGREFQTWSADYSEWDPSVAGAGRLSSFSFPHLAATGIDVAGNWVYAVSQSMGSPGDALQVLYAP